MDALKFIPAGYNKIQDLLSRLFYRRTYMILSIRANISGGVDLENNSKIKLEILSFQDRLDILLKERPGGSIRSGYD